MDKELKRIDNPPPPAPKRSPKPLWQPQAERKPVVIEIQSISGAALNLICKKHSDYELFSVTLQEIDSLIDQQRTQNDVLFDYLDVFCTAYLDNILIYSENKLEYTAQVRLVL
jgi:hypothetical protein